MNNRLILSFLIFIFSFPSCRKEEPNEVERDKSGKYIIENEAGELVIAATKKLYNYDHTYFLLVNHKGEFKSGYRFGLKGDEIPVSLGVNYNGNYVVLTNSQPAYSNISHCRFVICEDDGKPISFEELTKDKEQEVDNYVPTAMVRNENNTYTIAGNLIKEGEEEPFFARVHEGGALEWLKSPEFVNNRKALGIMTTSIGENVIAGSAGTNSFLFKIDKKGEYLWTKSFSFSGHSFAQNLFETTSEDLFVVGGCGANLEQTYLLKTSANGDSLWSEIYQGELPENMGVQILSNSEVILALNQENQFDLIKVNGSGDLIWEKSHQSALGPVKINAILALKDQSILVVGDILNVNGISYIYISKFDATGNQMWETGL